MKHDERPIEPMTAGELRGALDDIGLSPRVFAYLIGVPPRTLTYWMSSDETISNGAAVALIRMIRSEPRKVLGMMQETRGMIGAEAPPRPRGRPPKINA